MDEEKVVVPETTKEVTPEVTPEESGEEVVEESEESVAEVKARLAKAEELANNYKVRAEKAERKVAKDAPIIREAKSDIPSKDLIAIMNAKVHEEDIDEVLDYAKFKKISVSEALKSNAIKSHLRDQEEKRTTAEATNTGKTRGGNSKLSGEALLNIAREKGEVPEKADDLDALLEARYKSK